MTADEPVEQKDFGSGEPDGAEQDALVIAGPAWGVASQPGSTTGVGLLVANTTTSAPPTACWAFGAACAGRSSSARARRAKACLRFSGGVFDAQAVTAAMIDHVVHHADVLTLEGASYRLRNRGFDTLPSIRAQDTAD